MLERFSETTIAEARLMAEATNGGSWDTDYSEAQKVGWCMKAEWAMKRYISPAIRLLEVATTEFPENYGADFWDGFKKLKERVPPHAVTEWMGRPATPLDHYLADAAGISPDFKVVDWENGGSEEQIAYDAEAIERYLQDYEDQR